MWPRCLYGNIPNPLLEPSSPPAEKSSGHLSLDSITSSESPESGYKGDSDESKNLEIGFLYFEISIFPVHSSSM